MPMPDFAFLPDWPLPVSGLVLFGALLLAGLGGGVLARRLSLPAITGYIAVGMVLVAPIEVLREHAEHQQRHFTEGTRDTMSG